MRPAGNRDRFGSPRLSLREVVRGGFSRFASSEAMTFQFARRPSVRIEEDVLLGGHLGDRQLPVAGGQAPSTAVRPPQSQRVRRRGIER